MKIFTHFLLRKFAHVLGKGMRNFAASEGGSPAVEFSLVLTPFLILFFGIFETGIIYLKQMTVESATAVASRQLRTGVAQQSNDAFALFRDALCRETGVVIPCADLRIDVRSFPTVPDVSQLPDVPTTNNNPNFEPGSPGDIVIVRVAYTWDFLTPFINELVSPGNEETYVASAVFRVEPFEGELN